MSAKNGDLIGGFERVSLGQSKNPQKTEGIARERESTHSELLKSESTARSDTSVVALSGAANSGAQRSGNGAGRHADGLLQAGLTAAELAGGLVQPCADTRLPVLVEMSIGDDVVDHGDCNKFEKQKEKCTTKMHVVELNATMRIMLTMCAQN